MGDELVVHGYLDVRRADQDLRDVANRIIGLLDSQPNVVVDISQQLKHGNRIVIRATAPVPEDAS